MRNTLLVILILSLGKTPRHPKIALEYNLKENETHNYGRNIYLPSISATVLALIDFFVYLSYKLDLAVYLLLKVVTVILPLL